MALLLLMTGFFEVESQAIVVICLILVHLFIFQNTQGPVVWIYASEVVAEGSLGMCILTSSVVSLLVTLSTGSIMQVFGTSGVFWFFGTLTLVGGVFVKLYIVETNGLSAIQKKKVFANKKVF